MADFPFFNESMKDFPGLQGLSGQSYRDTFDYAQYGAPAKLRLLNVPWRSDYRDVVYFDTEAARDAWFSRQSSEIVEYSTPWLRVPSQSVNIPLPYDKAAYFNYLYLDIPARPVDNGNEPARLFYFITDIRYAAPSTTVLELELDVWQTYGHRMDVESLYLERGHAPMRRVSVDDFLENPIGHTRYLLAKDVDYSNGSERVASVEHYPIGDGEKFLILALPVAPADLAAIGTGSAAAATPPAYSDTAARNGYQLEVGGYAWAHGGREYSDIELPITTGASSDGRTLDGSYIYGIEYPGAKAALAALAASCPHVLAAAAYAAVIPGELAQFESSYTIAGYTWHHLKANPQVEIEPYELTPANIGLPAYAADIAKAYTYPYTRLMVQDQEGRGFEVRIEDIAGDALEFNADISLASASLMFNIEAVNVGTLEESVISWATLDGSEFTTLYGSDLAAHMIEWGIPTYSVSLSAGTLEAARRWKALEAQRRAALNSYHQAVRGANTALENTQDANAVAVTNTANSNATATANMTASNNTATANTTLANTTRTTMTTVHNSFSKYNTDSSNDLNSSNAAQAVRIQALTTVTQNEAVALSAAASIGASIAHAGLSMAEGNLAGGVAAGASMASSAFTAWNSISNNSNLNGAVSDANTYNANRANDTATDIMLNNNAVATRAASENNALATDTQNNNNTLSSTLTANNNSLATSTTANNTGVSNSNAGYSRTDAITAAKENLEQAQRAALAALDSAALDIVRTGSVTGDNALDAFNRRSFAVKAITQSDYALRAACDYFKRYGYALAAPIDFVSWLEQGEYCYWKGSRAIIKGNVPDLYRNALEGILEQGVTVWSAPEKVGDYE